MTLKQFQMKTMWLDPDATLFWLGPDGSEVEFEAVFEPANFAGKIVVRGAPTEKEFQAVADRVRLAIEGSNLGREE